MKQDEIINKLKQQFADIEFNDDENNKEAYYIGKESLKSVINYLKNNEELNFDYLIFITAVDYKSHIELVYYLFSYKYKHRLVLKVRLNDLNDLKIDTISDIYKTADWNEREIYDLFGVTFAGHPDLRRILSPEDLDGHSLRKNFTHPNLIHKPETAQF